jgi:arylsulfatase A-like enzyme
MRSKTLSLAVLAAVPTIAAADVTDPSTPNIVMVILDDVSVDGVGAYGPDFPTYAPANRPNTQAIDSLAAAGVRFKRAWATPLCSSTRASIQTGMHPFRTGVGSAYGENVEGLDPAAYTTLAGSFTANGYTTGAFGKWHIGTENAAGVLGFPPLGPITSAPHPARWGWTRFFGNLGGYPGPSAADPLDGYYRWQRVNWLGGSNSGNAAYEDNGVHMTDRTIEVASSWINSRTEPFLAMVALNAGHSGTSASTTWSVADVNTNLGKYRTGSLSCLAAGTCGNAVTTTRRAYQALVEHADIMIEELLNNMDPATLDNTIIVVMGDNGTPFAAAEGAFRVAGRGKGSTYENGVRVPLIVAEGSAWRTGVAGTRIPVINRLVDAKVHLLDTFNTLHELAFGSTIAGVDSVSYNDCLSINDIYCNRTPGRFGYTETFPLTGVAFGTETKIVASYHHDTMTACYMPAATAGAPATGCLQETFYDVSTDPLQTAPQPWTGLRANRLRNYFTTLHTGTGSWAEPAGVVLPFCPPAVVAVCP